LLIRRSVIDKDLCLTGADPWAVEVVPNPNKRLGSPCHSELWTKQAYILNHENLILII
jgi:hypothetical protein